MIFSASVMCANFLKLGDDLKALEQGGCDELHFDIMDGLFVPNITLGFDIIKQVKRGTTLPCNAHLMISRPEDYIKRFAEAGCDSITIHLETCRHAPRLLAQIRELGVSPGIAVNPATPLTDLEYLLSYVDRVLMMTVDPGYAGQTILPVAFERVKILKEVIDYRRLAVKIEVDGNISVQNGARLVRDGAEILVLGTASIFKGGDLVEATKKFRTDVSVAQLSI